MTGARRPWGSASPDARGCHFGQSTAPCRPRCSSIFLNTAESSLLAMLCRDARMPCAQDAQERRLCRDARMPCAQDAQERRLCRDARMPRAQDAQERRLCRDARMPCAQAELANLMEAANQVCAENCRKIPTLIFLKRNAATAAAMTRAVFR